MKTFEGKLSAKGKKFGIVISRFNELISKRLLEGAVDSINRHEGSEDNVAVAWVPGAFELPIVAQKMAKSGNYDALICLGAVIRGETPHFEYVAAESIKGIASASKESDLPITMGVITADNVDQAVERAGVKSGNKGWQAASAAIEMVNLVDQIE